MGRKADAMMVGQDRGAPMTDDNHSLSDVDLCLSISMGTTLAVPLTFEIRSRAMTHPSSRSLPLTVATGRERSAI